MKKSNFFRLHEKQEVDQSKVTVLEYAELSNQVYTPEGGKPPEGWEVLEHLYFDDFPLEELKQGKVDALQKWGLGAAVYINRTKQELIVAFRGTTDWKDLITDARLALGGKIARLKGANEFAEKVIQKLKPEPTLSKPEKVAAHRLLAHLSQTYNEEILFDLHRWILSEDEKIAKAAETELSELNQKDNNNVSPMPNLDKLNDMQDVEKLAKDAVSKHDSELAKCCVRKRLEFAVNGSKKLKDQELYNKIDTELKNAPNEKKLKEKIEERESCHETMKREILPALISVTSRYRQQANQAKQEYEKNPTKESGRSKEIAEELFNIVQEVADEFSSKEICKIQESRQPAFRQLRRSMRFAEQSAASLGLNDDLKTLEKCLLNYKISFTGHSLGAFIAELCACRFDKRAVTFESPGSGDIIQCDEIYNHNRKKNVFNNLISYVMAPNFINTACFHLGHIIRIHKHYETSTEHMVKCFGSSFKRVLAMGTVASVSVPFLGAATVPLALGTVSVGVGNKLFEVYDEIMSDLNNHYMKTIIPALKNPEKLTLMKSWPQGKGLTILATILNSLDVSSAKKWFEMLEGIVPFQKTTYGVHNITGEGKKRIEETKIEGLIGYNEEMIIDNLPSQPIPDLAKITNPGQRSPQQSPSREIKEEDVVEELKQRLGSVNKSV